MNRVLFDSFQHNSWATKLLLTTCSQLNEEQLATTVVGSYGNIIATFNHIILSDARYLHHLSGNAPAWLLNRDLTSDFALLEARAEEVATNWIQFLAVPLDGEQLTILVSGDYEIHAGALIAQALHHSNIHREQICAILTSLGIEPPDIQPWSYAHGIGRGRELPSEQ
ncbi:DinB family protein [Herpetosiphon llansteffanensis]|uniref:DinB family protein n=1 Tax=Herpetosiphon llansteffanensis TaxID=2094568 RepID=UPI000D7BE1FB|nr:DinB family protein [Herpetosiphon llansteffanensis]